MKEKYLKARAALLEEARALIDKGDIDGFRAKEAEIVALDEKYEQEATARADFEAINSPPAGRLDFSAMSLTTPLGAAVVERMGQDDLTEPDDFTNSTEYRKAFRAYVLSGTPMSRTLRNADQNTLTTDVETAIPTILINRIIEKIESIGMILPLVTRTSYAAGVNIPTSNVKPVATWVGEGESSDRQKKTTGVITFTHHKLRCEISMSMETATMAISAFEAAFVRQVSEGMVKAIESKIISADQGLLSNRGILAETPQSGQALTADALSYGLLVDAEAALPQAYESGAIWCMTKRTFMGFIGLTDSTGQPIARVNYGLGGSPERTLLGRSVVLCGDYMDSFSETLASGKVFAFLFNFSDYILNTIYDMGVQRKQDWDTEDLLTKAVMSVDGKVVDSHSLVTVTMV